MAGEQVLLAIVVIAGISGICSAATHTVGDTTGWTIPSSPSFYSDWAGRQKFKVGDVLVFNFPTNTHTVAKVNKANYDNCGTRNTIGAVLTNGPANVTLNAAGAHYFICTIGNHCTSNQKLAVTVGASTGSPASSPAPSGGAASPPGSATTPAGSADSPAGGAGSADTPSGSAAEGPSGSSPAGSFATSTGVSLLSLVSVGVAALMF